MIADTLNGREVFTDAFFFAKVSTSILVSYNILLVIALRLFARLAVSQNIAQFCSFFLSPEDSLSQYSLRWTQSFLYIYHKNSWSQC